MGITLVFLCVVQILAASNQSQPLATGTINECVTGEAREETIVLMGRISDDKKVRVESFVIPLGEIKRKSGDTVRMAYWASSPKPPLTLNSVGYTQDGEYYSSDLPKAQYHLLQLVNQSSSLNMKLVPEGREDAPNEAEKPPKEKPALGFIPPEIAAKEWLNTQDTPSLAELGGQVVLIEFWATWCGPCLAGIPHLNDLHDKYSSKGLKILGITNVSRSAVENLVQQIPIKYAVGTGTRLSQDYGVDSIPHAFLIGKDGKLLWEGHPASDEMENKIADALGGNKTVDAGHNKHHDQLHQTTSRRQTVARLKTAGSVVLYSIVFPALFLTKLTLRLTGTAFVSIAIAPDVDKIISYAEQGGDLNNLIKDLPVSLKSLKYFGRFGCLESKKQETLLIRAIRTGHIGVARSLLSNGANPNAPDATGSTPLHWAIWDNRPRYVNLLLSYGADPNRQNKMGKTPLHVAAEAKCSASLVETLLENGANPTLVDNEGKNPLQYALTNNPDIVTLLRLYGAVDFKVKSVPAPTDANPTDNHAASVTNETLLWPSRPNL